MARHEDQQAKGTIAFSKAGRVMMSRGLMSRFISSSNALRDRHVQLSLQVDLQAEHVRVTAGMTPRCTAHAAPFACAAPFGLRTPHGEQLLP